MQRNITIRPATIDDAEFIASNVLAAIGLDFPGKEHIEKLADICRRTDTLYSWKNTVIAMVDGADAGSITAYDGARYKAMRAITFPLFVPITGNDFSHMVDETCEGEFYVDSLAVVPQFRQMGVARALLRYSFQQATNAHIPLTTIAVDPLNEKALRLYTSVGFHDTGEIFIFDYGYHRMEKQNNPSES